LKISIDIAAVEPRPKRCPRDRALKRRTECCDLSWLDSSKSIDPLERHPQISQRALRKLFHSLFHSAIWKSMLRRSFTEG
jgi:hypothetical protein